MATISDQNKDDEISVCFEGGASNEEAETVDANDDESDDMTVIVLDPHSYSGAQHHANASWLERSRPELEEQRRAALLRELRRVQRASFFHFMVLCLIPVVLMSKCLLARHTHADVLNIITYLLWMHSISHGLFTVVVVATVLGDQEECFSEWTSCTLEPRSFINAFTTQCVCEAIATSYSSGME